MRKCCDTCLHDEFSETFCNDCYSTSKKPPTKWEPAPFWTPDTNADRIRAMTDEELEEFIRRTSIGCEPWCDHHCKMNGDDNCNLCLAKWLKQPAEGD